MRARRRCNNLVQIFSSNYLPYEDLVGTFSLSGGRPVIGIRKQPLEIREPSIAAHARHRVSLWRTKAINGKDAAGASSRDDIGIY